MPSYYGTAKKTQHGEVVPAIVDAENCRIEWNFAKEMVVREHYPIGQIADLSKLLATHLRDEVQNFNNLHLFCLPIEQVVREASVHRTGLKKH